MKELKVGEGVYIKCVENLDCTCEKCVLFHSENLCMKRVFGECTPEYRTDGKNVHFELVEE